MGRPKGSKNKTQTEIMCGHSERPHEAHGLCPSCYTAQWKKDHPERDRTVEQERSRHLKLREALKLEVLTHYSPEGTLGCCWEGCRVTDIDMLSLDHKEDNGASQRRETNVGKGTDAYRWARNSDYPDMFQTLCGSHQMKKLCLQKRKARK